MPSNDILSAIFVGLPQINEPCMLCGDITSIRRLAQDFSTGYVIPCCEVCFLRYEYFRGDQDCTNAVICPMCNASTPLQNFHFVDSLHYSICIFCYESWYTANIWECDGCHETFTGRGEIGPCRVMVDNVVRTLCSDCSLSFHRYSPYHGPQNNSDCRIHDYGYNPEFQFYKTDKDKRNLLYYGIELEVESMGNSKNKVLEQLPDFTYTKYDSSLTDGFEIVSHPATYNWLTTNMDKWNNICCNLRQAGYRSYQTKTCAMHIHLSKKAFTPFHLHKFMVFISRNPRLSNKIGQRRLDNMPSGRYRIFHEDNKTLVHKAKVKYNEREDRYVAVNLHRRHTVELRIFKGTLSLPYFWKNVEFTNLLYDFSLNHALAEMKTANFREYLEYSRKEYPYLYGFLHPPEFSLKNNKADKSIKIIFDKNI